jgi:hypothetical protein
MSRFKQFSYFGDRVDVPRSAEMPKTYRPGGEHAHLVQEAIE